MTCGAGLTPGYPAPQPAVYYPDPVALPVYPALYPEPAYPAYPATYPEPTSTDSLWESTPYVPLLTQDTFASFIQSHEATLG